MDIDLLNEFIILSQCLNYSQAAQKLYISQSVLSRHIQNLESQLGVELFTRNKHSVALTPIGKIFAEDVEKVVRQYDKAMKHVQMAKDGSIGSLNIKTSSALSSLFVYDFLPKFSKKYPHIQVNLMIEEVSIFTKKEVEDQLIDFALLLDWTESASKDLSHITFFKNYFYAFIPEGHPLYDKECLEIYELSNLPMIYLDRDENRPSLTYFEELFRKHQAVYNPCVPASGVEDIFLKIISGNGISLLSEPVFRYAPSKIHTIPIKDSEACLNINLIWKTDTSNHCVDVFTKEFKAFAKPSKSCGN